jgi:hypothetical protein
MKKIIVGHETWKLLPQDNGGMLYHKNMYINFHVVNEDAIKALNFPEKRANYCKAYVLKMRDKNCNFKSLTKQDIEEINKQETMSILLLSEWLSENLQ